MTFLPPTDQDGRDVLKRLDNISEYPFYVYLKRSAYPIYKNIIYNSGIHLNDIIDYGDEIRFKRKQDCDLFKLLAIDFVEG